MSADVKTGQLVRVKCEILDKTQYRPATFVDEVTDDKGTFVRVILKGQGLDPYVITPDRVFVNGRRYAENPLPVTFAKVGDVLRTTKHPEGTPRQMTVWIVDAIVFISDPLTGQVQPHHYHLVNVATGKIGETDFKDDLGWVWGS